MSDFQPSQLWWARTGKRAFDVVVCVPTLLVLSPLLLLIAMLVKLTSRGPVLFSQERIGRNGTRFQVFKFRSMRAGRTPDPKEIVPLFHPEVTPIGRTLRRLKLDELPQLVCVIRGDMSLIGPRPTLPDQVAQYDEFKRRRLIARPGITGLAQVNGNTAIDWDERIQYDVYYVSHCGFLLDMTILVKTFLVPFVDESRWARPFRQSPYAGKLVP